MSILTYTIAPERLAQIEQAVGFEVNNNKDMDYALELLCGAVMPKIAQRVDAETVAEREALMQMLKGMLE